MPKSKKRKPTSSKRSVKPKTRLVFSEFVITWEPIGDEWVEQLSEEMKQSLGNLYYLTREDPKQAAKELPSWIEKYPNLPVLYNYLCLAYSQTGEHDKAGKVAEQNYLNNPDYLFGILNFAEVCLAKGEIEKVAEILDYKFDLKAFYPHRNEFHISEFMSFMSLVGRYYNATGKRDAAESIYEVMLKVDPDNHLIHHMRDDLYPLRLRQILNSLQARS